MSFGGETGFGDCVSPDREKVCGCIDKAGAVIAAAIDKLGETLGKKTDKGCEVVEKCSEEIYQQIKKRVEKGTETCQECQQLAKNGAAGTLEYAVACAGACIKSCNATCSLGDTSSEGQCCNYCGSANCTCKNGDCVKVETKPETGNYTAWCNQFTGVYVVTNKGQPEPGPGFTKVSVSETEVEAMAAAASACQRQQQYPTGPGPFQPPDVAPFTTPNCNILDFGSYSGVTRVLNRNGSAASSAFLTALISNTIQSGVASAGSGGAVAALTGGLMGLIQIPAAALQFTPPLVSSAVGCSDEQFNIGVANLAALGALQRYVGLDVSDFTNAIRYAMHSICRQVQLDPNSAMSAYLANAIDYKVLDTHYAIAGVCPDSVKWQLQAQRAKPIPNQLAMLRRRKLIDDSGYNAGMRQLGYLEQGVVDNLFQLTENLPTLSDIIRFMVRDSGDDNLARDLGTDDFFDTKYNAKLKDWSESQGVPEDVAKYAWRAHWTIPSPTQLFEFYHRLRKGDKFGGEAELLKNIKSALVQQDILPFWHDYYLATSFRPMTRVDIRRAYNIGTIERDELPGLYAQLGYSDEVSEKLSKFTDRLRDLSLPSHRAIKLWKQFSITRNVARERMLRDGLPVEKVDEALQDAEPSFASSPYALAFVRGDIARDTFISFLSDIGVSNQGALEIANRLAVKITNHKALKGYAVGALSRDRAFGQMTGDGMDSAVSNRLLDELDQQVDYELIARCQAGIKRRYLLGEITRDESIAELVARGTTKDRADKLASWYDCERLSRGSKIAISKLCEFLSRGVIDIADFRTRLKRLGYNDGDAALLTEDCLSAINTKREAQARKEAKEQAAQAEKAANAIAKQNRAIEQADKRMESARLASARARGNREKQLLSASAKLAKKCDCDINHAVGLIRQQRDRVIREFGLSIDETLQTLLLAVEGWEGGDPALYGNVVTLFAEAAVSESLAVQS